MHAMEQYPAIKKKFFIHCSLDEFPVGKMDKIMKGQEEKYP